jgi:hypothetical protein
LPVLKNNRSESLILYWDKLLFILTAKAYKSGDKGMEKILIQIRGVKEEVKVFVLNKFID